MLKLKHDDDDVDDEAVSTSNEDGSTELPEEVATNGHDVKGSADDSTSSSDAEDHEQRINVRALSPEDMRKDEMEVAEDPTGDENPDGRDEHGKEFLQLADENVGSSLQELDEQESDREDSEIESNIISDVNGTTEVVENKQEESAHSSSENQDAYEPVHQSSSSTSSGEDSRHSEEAVNSAPVPAPRKNRPAARALGSHPGECNTNHSNVHLERELNDKNNGVLEQIIQTGEEKLI